MDEERDGGGWGRIGSSDHMLAINYPPSNGSAFCIHLHLLLIKTDSTHIHTNSL